MLDIFKQDAFSIVSLTTAINNIKFVPGYIGSLGIFQSNPVTTTAVAIEMQNGILKLIPPTPRGGPGVTLPKEGRNIRWVGVPHFEINDAVMAEEVQGIRAFGSETTLETVQGKVGGRIQLAGQSLEATLEYARIGAIKGIVTYADGSQLNLFKLFDVEAQQPGFVSLNLGAANPVMGALRKQLQQVLREMGAQLEGVPWSGAIGLCGNNFFDLLVSHPEVRQTYLNQSEARQLREGYLTFNGLTFGFFEFAGILFVNYRGSVDGVDYIATNDCQLFPAGAPGLFQTFWAPADYIETVNTLGKPRYVKQYVMQNEKGIHLDTQMNSLNICTRPLALRRLTI